MAKTLVFVCSDYRTAQVYKEIMQFHFGDDQEILIAESLQEAVEIIERKAQEIPAVSAWQCDLESAEAFIQFAKIAGENREIIILTNMCTMHHYDIAEITRITGCKYFEFARPQSYWSFMRELLAQPS
jgi:endonuclease V-like protein UPF0215 family